MKPFVWRLQKVLDVKRKQEQFKRAELFRLTEHLAQKRSELLLRWRLLEDLMADIAGSPASGRWSAQEFFFRHATVDDAQIRRLQQEIADLEIRQKQKRTEVLAARRFAEGLEKLRARAREEFLRKEEKFEQKELDERTTISFALREPAAEPGNVAPTAANRPTQ
jgi:flagellar export protein FliJ